MNYKLIFVISFIFIGFYSCNYSVNHNIRKAYENIHDVIYTKQYNLPFLKPHFKNGDVAILNDWNLNSSRDSIYGYGSLYNFNRFIIKKGILSFDIDDISIIETNDLSSIKSTNKVNIAILAILAIGNLSLSIYCATNPKACFGSCPTFYIDGKGSLHSSNAEGFSSSFAPALEKKDIDDLSYTSSSDNFSITMKNEALETHMINELSLYAIKKPKEAEVYKDSKDKFYTCSKPSGYNKILSSNDVNNTKIEYDMRKIDDDEYFSLTDPNDLSTKESIIVEFDDLNHDQLGLVMNFRQSLVSTFLFYSCLSYMGKDYGKFFSYMENTPEAKFILSRLYNKIGGIKLYLFNDNKWELFEEIYEAGPIAKNLIIAKLPKYAKSKKIKIKMEMAKGFWRLDYLGLSKVYNEVSPNIIYPDSIDIIKGSKYNIKDIAKDDKNYLVSFPEDEFNFKFKLPKINDYQEHKLFLYSKGYYLEWMRPNWVKEKDINKLNGMLRGDMKVWKDLAREFKTMESEAEEAFWNSKQGIK